MTQQDFENWFQEIKESAMQDFGYSQVEASNFNRRDWESYYEQGMTPFESIVQHLKNAFKYQNG